MYASFVIHFHTGRMDNVLQTLRFLEKNHLGVIEKSQLVLMCQDSCDPIPNKFLKYNHHNMDVECMQIPVLTNFGVDHSDADRIVVLESDRILPAGYFDEVLEEVREGIIITAREMDKLLAPATDEEIIAGEYETYCDSRSPTSELGIKNLWSGNTTFVKSDFYRVGKMDETYRGYGWADYDMCFTTEAAGIRSIYKEGWKELHLWHEGQTYGTGDQKGMYIDNCLYFCRKWGKQVPPYMIEEIMNHRKAKLLT